jgi:hypothetical protein
MQKIRIRHASAVTYKFMATIAGQKLGFKQVSRVLFAQNRELFEHFATNWSKDVNIHLRKLSMKAFEW